MPENATGTIDFSRLTTTQMEQATGIARMQLHRWIARGMPTNADGGFDLPAFIDWLRRNPRIGRPRAYRRNPGAVEARIIERINQVIHEELSRGGLDVQEGGAATEKEITIDVKETE